MRTYFSETGSGGLEFNPIGFVKSPYKEKFGIPRQPSLSNQVQGTIVLMNDPDLVTAVRDLEQFSHIWLIFLFHDHGGKNWKPSIRPPRLGGKRKVGVLASRSPHRPNPIGISVAKLEKILVIKNQIHIRILGIDVLDGTPVLDIKPYISYADSVPDAKMGWANSEIEKYQIVFPEEVQEKLNVDEINLIVQTLEIDPRPAHQKRELPPSVSEEKNCEFRIAIGRFEIKYQFSLGKILISSIQF